MKVLVIGCGSIGQKHIRNLISLGLKNIIAFDIDQRKLKQVRRISSTIEVSDKLNCLWGKKPQIVFITVPNSMHIKYSLEAAKRGCHLFIEKPLAHNLKGLGRLFSIVRQKKLITMVGCNMRFYWAIDRIKNLLYEEKIGRIISARIEAGQYLPDWHPGENYRKMYSARKELGGGIVLDGIHEIDYALWFFGEAEKVLSMYGKLSRLEIETEDTAEAILKFRNGPMVNIHLDYVQRVYARSCKIVGECGSISWDFRDHYVKLYLAKTKKWKILSEPKNYNIREMYIDEIKYFLTCVKRQQRTDNDIFEGFKTLQIALRIKRKGMLVS